MITNRLLLSVSKRDLRHLAPTDFVWLSPPGKSSFLTNIAPTWSQFPDTPRENIEFLRVAVLAYLVDRTTPRLSRRWSRDLDLQVPVWTPQPWLEVADELQTLFGFLTNDRWRLDFVRSWTTQSPEAREVPTGPAVTLFSGGADSLAGALIAERQLDGPPVLVSHYDWSLVRSKQRGLQAKLFCLWEQHLPAFSARVGRSSRQIGSGCQFGAEKTSRARSLLFVALGLAVAGTLGVPLQVPENGFASLNPPMGGERRGALSTRTTHPFYLSELQRILERVGAYAVIQNPFVNQTKGQMFAQVAAELGQDQASGLLSASYSCTRGDIRFAGVTGAVHCGVCFGCLVRRAAFVGAGLPDQTTYLIEDLTTPVGGWYSEKRRRDLVAVRYAAHRGIDIAEVIRNLPSSVDPDSAIDMATRGLDELGALVL